MTSAPHVYPLALCLGLASANAYRPAPLVLLVAALTVLGAALGLSRSTGVVAVCGTLVLAGAWWGAARLDALDRSVLAPEVGDAGRFVVAVTGPARRSELSVRVPAEARRFAGREVREPILLQLPPARSPPQGAVLELIGEVSAPRGPENGFDERAWLRRRGAHVVVHADRYRVVGRRGGVPGAADRLRRALSRSMAPGLRGERRAVLAGILLGEDEGLSDDLRDAFRASGLYHLLAVSGQNVALVAGGALLLAWFAGASRMLGQLAALTSIAGYVMAVGWQPSVVRAGVAGALASLAWLLARPRDRWYFLLLGGVVLLGWNPYSLLEPGFQLSFGAVAAIFLVVPRLERALEGYPGPRWLRGAVAVSVACGGATAPILLLHFGTVPIYSVVSNAMAAPAVAPLLGLAFAAAAIHPLAPGVAGAIGWVNGWLAAYLAACARLIGGLPYAQVSTMTALGVLAAVVASIIVVPRLREPRLPRFAALVAVVALAGAGWKQAHPQDVLSPPKGFRITFLDVGQGDAVLLQVPQGAVLVDQGPPEGQVASQLRRLGVRRLSLLVLTHPQRDHIGGAADVLEELHVDSILDPRLQAESPEQDRAMAAARRRHVPVLVARAGAVYRLGPLRLRVLWPDGPGPAGDDPNDHAVVLAASYGAVDALLTADAETNVTGRLHPPPVEILKVAHHGSADDGLGDQLAEIRPRVAVISVGKGNDYGHPTPSTLATLDRVAGLDVYRTDRHGRVVVESDGRRLSVRTEH